MEKPDGGDKKTVADLTKKYADVTNDPGNVKLLENQLSAEKGKPGGGDLTLLTYLGQQLAEALKKAAHPPPR